jgi:group I intron endonuclease
MNSGVYEIINKVNGKKYVGSTVNLRVRWNKHKRLLKKGKHHNAHLQNAWDKYGKKNFRFNVLAYLEDEELIRVENLLLASEKYEYNIAIDAKAPNRGCFGEANPMYGKKHSKETLEKISDAVSGENHPFYGTKRPLEHRKNISKGKLGKNNPNYVSFSEKEVAQMRALREQGKYYKEIAELFGCSWTTVRRRVLNITRSKY